MGELRVLNEKGDERIDWDPADEGSVTKARAEFDRLADKGYEFYEVADTRGKRVEAFDPAAGRLIAAPGARKGKAQRMAGGPVMSGHAGAGW